MGGRSVFANVSPEERREIRKMLEAEHRRGEHAEPLAVVGCPRCEAEGRISE